MRAAHGLLRLKIRTFFCHAHCKVRDVRAHSSYTASAHTSILLRTVAAHTFMSVRLIRANTSTAPLLGALGLRDDLSSHTKITTVRTMDRAS